MSAPLDGLTVALEEGRQLEELAQMLEKEGAKPLRCPMVSMFDAPAPGPVLAWLDELTAGRFDYLVLLTGDLGYTVVEPFAERFPDRFFNVGVAEQNLVGLATGLAEGGFLPFVYSIATFATMQNATSSPWLRKRGLPFTPSSHRIYRTR